MNTEQDRLNVATPQYSVRREISNWLLSLFNMPLYRNGLALVFSLVSTSGLGIIYWALAARTYSPTILGINSAIISAMMFLSNISQFGLVNFLTRFVPKAGHKTKRLIVMSYTLSLSIALVTSTIYVLGIEIWSPTLSILRSSPLISFWFIGATLAWCVFALQDGVLVGLRQATWVPVENIIFALAKMVLLVIFADRMVEFGIFASWTLPIILLIPLVNVILFRIFIPKHTRETETDAENFSIRQMMSFVSGDYLSTLVWMATVNLMPLLIIEIAGPEVNAYFYLPWMISYSLYLISRNLGMSLTVEAAKEQSKLTEYSRQSLTQTAGLLIPIVLVITIAAPLVLQIFGGEYVTEGVGLLRLLALSSLPNAITTLYISIARVQRKVFHIVLVLGCLCIMAISFTLYGLEHYGLEGIGMAWLLSQTFVACALLLTNFRRVLFPGKSNPTT